MHYHSIICIKNDAKLFFFCCKNCFSEQHFIFAHGRTKDVASGGLEGLNQSSKSVEINLETKDCLVKENT